MTIAGNMSAMAALLAANNFSAANFQASMSMENTQTAISPAPSAEPEQKIQVGQMKAEIPENTVENAQANNNGLDSIRADLEAKAQQFENTALALSDQGAKLAESELTADSKFTPASSKGLVRQVDNMINNLIFGADKSGQGADVSLADLGDMPVETKGIQQRVQQTGRGGVA